MSRDYAAVNVAIWADPDFRALPPAAQHLYLLLWTAPSLTYCGVHDWRPGRLASLSVGFTAEHIAMVADCLIARHFLVVDEGTEEALVRSWARFDGLLKKPRMAVSFSTAYASVASSKIRSVLAHEVVKIKTEQPGLACWNDARVSAILGHPAAAARDLPVPSDPFAHPVDDGLPLGLPLGLPQTPLGVCPPSTPSPTPTPTPKRQTPSSADADAAFETFWSAYPRKVGKAAARKAWNSATKKNSAENITAGLRAQLPLLLASEEQFQPHAATWLNAGRWQDEPPATPRRVNGWWNDQ